MTGPGTPDPTGPDPTGPEPTNPDPHESEPTGTDPAGTDPAGAEATRPSAPPAPPAPDAPGSPTVGGPPDGDLAVGIPILLKAAHLFKEQDRGMDYALDVVEYLTVDLATWLTGIAPDGSGRGQEPSERARHLGRMVDQLCAMSTLVELSLRRRSEQGDPPPPGSCSSRPASSPGGPPAPPVLSPGQSPGPRGTPRLARPRLARPLTR